MTVTLSNQASIILNQNDPNPFAQNTTITYSIPDEVKRTTLIYDNNGTILKTITINEKGQAVF
jgi:frataxin-like iron-binding protein CyaY